MNTTPLLNETQRRPWLLAFTTVTLVQMEASFMMICLPVCGPALTGAFHLAPQRIGLIGASIWAGALAFVFVGGFVLNRFPPVRLFQIVVLLAAAALALTLANSVFLLFLGALAIGLAYGPNIPAGSMILADRVPRERSSMLFSIKQGGVSIGNVLAGLILAPLAAWAGYRGAVLFAIATALVAAISLIFAAPHLKVNATARPVRSLRETIVGPLGLVLRNAALRTRAVLALALAAAQGTTTNFMIAYLVTQLGLPMARAGLVFAVLQGGGFAGRVLCGWLADKTGTPGRNLAIQALLAALSMLGIGLLGPHAPLPILLGLAVITGITALGWNGVFIAEAATLARPGTIAETTAGAVSIIYFSNMAAPALGDIVVSASASWHAVFFVAAALTAGLALSVIRSPALGIHRRG